MRHRRRGALLALPVAAVLLAGCSSTPEADVRNDARAVIAAANDQSPERVRSAVEQLLSTLSAQVGSGDLTEAEAAPLREAALDVRDSLPVLEAQLSPTPTPTPEETEEPEPSEDPEPTPTPTPEPVETEEPEQTEEPEEPADEPTSPQVTEAPEDDADSATVVPQLPSLTPVAAVPTATPSA